MITNISSKSAIYRKKVQQHLRNFDFKALFVGELGWNTIKESPLTIHVDGAIYILNTLAEKRGVKVFLCSSDASGQIPADSTVRKIEREITNHAAYEHFIIYVDAAKEHQLWQWVKRDQSKRATSRINRYHKGQSGELLAQKLERLAIGLDEEEHLTMAEMTRRVAKAFDVERVTKKFYDRFKLEHVAFLQFIEGIERQTDREWYASLMLNRLMFIYFIQHKGLLGTTGSDLLDGDPSYLSNRLKHVQRQRGENQFHSFYRSFLLRLFHDGLNQRHHPPEIEALLGRVPYLNGGLFDVHILERTNREIDIPDEAFEMLFRFFDEFDWYLDDRPLRNDREINPDVLGYIFEKYINQKQMGAYYTKEDITEYISENTILPFLLDATEKRDFSAFRPDGPIWLLLRENPDAYIYDTVKKGCNLALPPEIEAGVHDITLRSGWNKPVPEVYALPNETWREVIARRTHYQEVRDLLASEQLTSVNDLITHNLNIRHFADDVITYCTSTRQLRAFYESITHVTILDPTCGSGAFLFAALNILEGLYEACLERMQDLVEEQMISNTAIESGKQSLPSDIIYFRSLLEQAHQHPNRTYFIYKSIIVHNLYGVDIMEEATETCKLRLFLKLASQIESMKDIEPLPDIDFNIRTGNTLVGFASYEETKQAIEGKTVGKSAKRGEVIIQNQMIFDDRLERIEQKAQEIERAFEHFRNLQRTLTLDSSDIAEYKHQLRQMLEKLRLELDGYLASEYGIDLHSIPKEDEYQARFMQWRQKHQPFHWWVEFYGIMQRGGFDVVIGNPPYVGYNKIKHLYEVKFYKTFACKNLYAYTMERSLSLVCQQSRFGMIVPVSAVSGESYQSLNELFLSHPRWISTYSNRPGKLFAGVEQRLTIFLVHISLQPALWTSPYQHWYEGEREHLFSTLIYCRASTWAYTGMPVKSGHALVEHIFLRLGQQKPLHLLLSQVSRVSGVWVHDGPTYWVRALPFEPNLEIKSQRSDHYHKISTRTQEEAVMLSALLSSSTFYLFYKLISNCRDLGQKEWLQLPFERPQANTEHLLTQLGSELAERLHRTASKRVRQYPSGPIEYEEYYPARAKDILDEIDHVLANHYGFTAEELDFIVNYDIQYRMGRDSEREEEE